MSEGSADDGDRRTGRRTGEDIVHLRYFLPTAVHAREVIEEVLKMGDLSEDKRAEFQRGQEDINRSRKYMKQISPKTGSFRPASLDNSRLWSSNRNSRHSRARGGAELAQRLVCSVFTLFRVLDVSS
jgi:hypothetical protein